MARNTTKSRHGSAKSRRGKAAKADTRSQRGLQTHWGWLLGAIAYGFSWPLLEGVNLSWLAWGAFVPLFIVLRAQHTFSPYAGHVLGFLGLATVIYCAGWFFGVPSWVMSKTAIGGMVQILLLAVPLLVLFWIKQRISFERALLLLVFFWPLWEWGMHYIPLSLNFLWVSNSQGANTWLIQYVDVFGAWAITAWVLLFNVLLYRAYGAANERFSKAFWGQVLRVSVLLLGVPALYAAVRYVMLEPADNPVRVTLISTENAPTLNRADLAFSNIERVVHLTDSTAYYRRGPQPDVYVWSEGTLGFDWEISNLRSFLYQAVDDWQTPLLTGTTMREARPTLPDTVFFNQTVLIHPGGDSARTLHTYNKIELMPMQEGIPGYSYLQTIPAVRVYFEETYKMTPGDRVVLLPLTVRDGRTIQLATPICHEVNFPEQWAEMTRAGADIFVQPTFESWFGNLGFQTILANITRIRTIENRRSTARSANGGPTVFIDAFGTMHHPAQKAEGSTTAVVDVYAERSLYTRFPYLFPLICILGLVWLGRSYLQEQHSTS